MDDRNEIPYSYGALALLKANLGYFDALIEPAVEAYLVDLLRYAYQALAEAGINLTSGVVYDDQLQAMYAAWMYRKGKEGGMKPPMLQNAIRNRQVCGASKREEV